MKSLLLAAGVAVVVPRVVAVPEPLVPDGREIVTDEDVVARIRRLAAMLPRERKAAVAALAELDNDVLPIALRLAEDPAEGMEIRGAAVETLGGLGPRAAGAVPLLSEFLARPETPFLAFTVEALSRVGAPAVPAMEAILRDSGSSLLSQCGAADVLGRVGLPAQRTVLLLNETLRGTNSEDLVRYAAAGALGRMAASTNTFVVAALLDAMGDERPEVRSAAQFASCDMSAKSLPVLLPWLEDPDADRRRRAAWVLEQVGARTGAGVGTLARILDKGPEDIRPEVVRTLGRIGPPAKMALPVLKRMAAESSGALLRDVTNAISRIEMESAAPPESLSKLIEDLRNPSTEVGWAAVESLAKTGATAVPELVRVLESDGGAASWRAAAALGRLGKAAQPALPALRKASERKDLIGAKAREAIAAIDAAP